MDLKTFDQKRLIAGSAGLAAAVTAIKAQPSARRGLVAGGITFVVALFGLEFAEAVAKQRSKAAERSEET